MKYNIDLIVAYSKNNVIGKDNKLLQELKDGLLNFKRITSGQTIAMGRKTFDSIGRALPNRKNIILTRNKNYSIDGCFIYNNFKEILELSKKEKVIIIGGEEIYNLFKEYVNIFHLTEVDTIIKGDAFFYPSLEKLTLEEESFQEMNDRNEFSWTYRKYIR